MFKKLLVGVDGSEHSMKALETALKLAEVYEAELFVFHAIHHHMNLPFFPLETDDDPRTKPTLFRITYQSSIQDIYMDSGSKIMEFAKQQVANMDKDGKIPTHYVLETDLPPPEAIEDFTRANRIDLVILGCIGQHSALRNAIGTTVTRVVNSAPCPVLIVR